MQKTVFILRHGGPNLTQQNGDCYLQARYRI